MVPPISWAITPTVPSLTDLALELQVLLALSPIQSKLQEPSEIIPGIAAGFLDPEPG
jgi:hypothetical protein